MSKNRLLILLFFIVIALFSFGWSRGEDFIVGGDSTWPFRFSEYLESNKLVWMDTSVPGNVNARQLANAFPLGFYGTLFENIGVSSSIFQKLVYFIAFFFSGWGSYLLMEKLTKSSLGGLLGGLFYMLSPYALLVVWNPSYGRNFPLYTFLPICLYFLVSYLEDSKKHLSKNYYLLVLVTFLSLLGASFNNPAFFVLFVGFVAFTIFVMFFKVSRERKYSVLTKGALFLITIVLLNAFWLGPFSTSFRSAFKMADNEVGGLINDSETRKLNSVFVKDALRGSGLWTMFAGHKNEPYYVFYEHWRGALYAITSFSLVLFAIYGVIKKKTKTSSVFLLLFAIGILLNSGVRWEIGADLVESLYRAPFIGRAFRSIYLKLGILLIVPLSYLISHAVSVVPNKKKMTVVAVVFFAIVVNALPFFTGEVIKPHGRLLAGYAVTYPDEYYGLAEHFSEGQKTKRILSLPHPRTYNYSFRWEDSAFNSVYLVWSLIDDPLMFMGTHSEMEGLSEGFNEEWLDKNSIGYVLIHKDIAVEDLPYFLPEGFPDLINEMVSHYPNSIVMNNKYFALLELPQNSTREIVYGQDGQEGIVQVTDLTRVNATLYRFRANPGEVKKIFLNDSYDPTWKLIASGSDHQFPHSSIAPLSWDISTVDSQEEVSFEIYLARQDMAERWRVISYLVFTGLLVGLVGTFIRGKK